MKRLLRDRGRLLISGGAALLALIVLIFPPWTARAIRTTIRYASVEGMAPVTLVDTVVWTLTAAPIFSPPRPVFTAAQVRELAGRSLAGDLAARSRLLQLTGAFERRYRAPEILRMSGELWRDSVLAAAGMPSLSSYDVSFTLDDAGIATRLAALAAILVVLEARRRGRSSTRPVRQITE